MNANTDTMRHDNETLRYEARALVERCGAGMFFSYNVHAGLYGTVGQVKKALAVLGFGFDKERTGKVQRIFDANGRSWGSISFADDGRCSASLDYIFGGRPARP